MDKLMEMLIEISERRGCVGEHATEVDRLFDMCSTAGQIGKPSVESVRQYVQPIVHRLDLLVSHEDILFPMPTGRAYRTPLNKGLMA